jgi:hypothetical protein
MEDARESPYLNIKEASAIVPNNFPIPAVIAIAGNYALYLARLRC